MPTATYTVTGMTCAHCVSSVTEEVSEITGVTEVTVDLPTGTLTVTSQNRISDDAVHSAVHDAGYRVAGS